MLPLTPESRNSDRRSESAREESNLRLAVISRLFLPLNYKPNGAEALRSRSARTGSAVGRVALESTSAALQAAAKPSQLPTRVAQRKGPASRSVTPGLSDHRRSDCGGVRWGVAGERTVDSPDSRRNNPCPRNRSVQNSTI